MPIVKYMVGYHIIVKLIWWQFSKPTRRHHYRIGPQFKSSIIIISNT